MTAARDGRVLAFRVAAVLTIVACLGAGGLASIQVPWGSPGRPFAGFTPELHRWHSTLLGVSEAILLPGCLLVLLRRPRRSPLLMQFFVVAGLCLVAPHLLARGSTPVASAFLVLPLLAYPAPRDLTRGGAGAWSYPRLGLALATASGLAFDAWRNLERQMAGLGGEHYSLGHWATAAGLCLALAVGGVLAASGRRGARALSAIVGLALLDLGAAALALPDHAGSWGTAGGALALMAGAAFVASMAMPATSARSEGVETPAGP